MEFIAHIMEIATEEYIFKKEIRSDTAYVLDEFGNEVSRFNSFANDFFSFDQDVTWYYKNKLIESNVLRDDEETMKLLK
jgi:hypothetical protein